MSLMVRRIVTMIAFAILSASSASAEPAITIGSLRFLGATNVPNDARVDGTLVGGLSGLDYDPTSGECAVISDDKSDEAPARFYLARIEPTAGAPKVKLEHAVIFKQANGQPYPDAEAGGEVPDPESIRFDPAGGKLWVVERRRQVTQFLAFEVLP
jgi:hypothetical protein